MKWLKRRFKMTKEQVEWNIRYVEYHRQYVKAFFAMRAVHCDHSLTREEKMHKIALIRKEFSDKKYGEPKDNDNI